MTLFDRAEPAQDDDDPRSAGTSPRDAALEPLAGPVLRLVVAYDGAGFHGFARQPGTRTVGGALADALGPVLRQPVELTCAGRTDAGVHAWGQVVTVRLAPGTDVDVDVDVVKVARSVTRQLQPEVVVRACDVVADDFDARRSATWRRYRYLVVNRPAPDPALARTAWWVEPPLDLHRLRLAADPIVGEHDFCAFCRKGPEGSSTVRRVTDSRWTDLGDGLLRYEITAKAFCWQMVRSIVGTQVDAGRGKLPPGEVLGLLRRKDGPRVPVIAPPHGLTLWSVGYDGWSTDDVVDAHPPQGRP